MPIPLDVQKKSTTFPFPGHEGVELTVINQPVENDAFPQGTLALSVFLVNHRKPVKEYKDTTYLFQAQLQLHCPEGFLPRCDPRQGTDTDPDEQVAALQYRQDYEFAVGHNIAAVASPDPDDPLLCKTIHTAWIPTYEVPRVDASRIETVELGMEAIAAITDRQTLQTQLRPLVTAYRDWLKAQEDCLPTLSNTHKKTAQQLLQNASIASDRINQGIDLLRDPHALKAFTIANKVIAKARRQQLSQEQGSPPDSFEPPQWRRPIS